MLLLLIFALALAPGTELRNLKEHNTPASAAKTSRKKKGESYAAYTQRQGNSLTSSSDQQLVRSSRSAILETGMSERYFDKHFQLIQSFNTPADMRVVWKYSLNGYETIVNDAVGFYTSANKRRVYLHSIKSILGATRDITRTISRPRAARLMKACIGVYAGEAIAFIKLSSNRAASFYLTAHPLGKISKRRDKGTRALKNGKNTANNTQEMDERESEKTEKRPPARIGYINLETGRCLKGQAIAGH